MPQIARYVAQVPDGARRWLNYREPPDLAEIKREVSRSTGALFLRRLFQEFRSRILLDWFRVADRISLKLQEFDSGVELRMADLDKGDAVRMEILIPILRVSVPGRHVAARFPR